MLTAHKLQIDPSDPASASQLAAYYAKYYAESGGEPGRWLGRGADALGLIGQSVSHQNLTNLMLGKSPDGSLQLVKVRIPKPEAAPQEGEVVVKDEQGKKPELHVPGFDLTFSAPKSVSALWAAANDEQRLIIMEAFNESVEECLHWLEDNLKLARRGKGGMEALSAGIVAAIFNHTTARNALDPQIHAHSLILNECLGDDGKWSKINSRLLLSWIRTMGPVFRNNLVHKLTERLGVEAYRPIVEGKPADWFELKGVDEGLTDHWSSRRKEILRETELLPGVRSDVKARQNANLRTRRKKGQRLDDVSLHQKWQGDAERFGFTQKVIRTVFNRSPQVDVERRVSEAITQAAKKCTEDQAYFNRQKFIQRVSEELQDVPLSGLDVLKRADAALKTGQFHSVTTERSKAPVYTTRSMWDLEQRMLADVESLQKTTGTRLSVRAIDKVLRKHTDLSPEQTVAARALLEDTSSIKTMTGVAGAGKTRTLGAVVEAYEKAGYKVLGGALAGTAKEELAVKAKIESRTVASYQYHLEKPTRQKIKEWVKHEAKMFVRQMQGKSRWEREAAPKLNKKTVLILDEAGMLDTRSAEPLIRHTKKAGATLILVGDSEQAPPIGAGGPFRTITKDGATCHLSENFRQRNSPDDARAAADVREGRINEMLENYASRGRLIVAKNRREAASQLVSEWAKDGGIAKPGDSIILTQTRAEARQINTMCQAARRLDGALASKSTVVENQVYHVGDVVLFHKAMKLKGIQNGYKATVFGVDSLKNTMTVMLDRELSEQDQRRGHTRKVTLNVKEVSEGHITLGYAATTHKMQGQSIPKTYCLLGGGMTSKELTYVQLTRGEQSTKLFIDKDHAGKKLTTLAEAMKQSGKKQLAHDLADEQRLHLRIERDGKDGK